MLGNILIYKGYIIEISIGTGAREGFCGDIYHGGGLKHSLGNPSKGGCVSECVSYINYFILEEK